MLSHCLMAAASKVVTSLNDPLLHEIGLPFHADYYPLGFHLKLASNSRHIFAAADEAWTGYRSQFKRPPLSIHIAVQPEGALANEAPVFRSQGALVTVVFDRHNFGAYDANSLFGYCFVSEATAADHLRLRLHFLEAMTYSLFAQTYAVPMHAAAVMRGNSGFLLCGPSGAGKSTLSYACACAGWTFISDDATWLPADCEGRIIVGTPRFARFRDDAPRLFPELERYSAAQRPNGKMTIEAVTAELPRIRTAERCRIDHLILLDRRARSPGRMIEIRPEDVIDRILADSPSYGASAREMYERTLARLLGASAWKLEYETLQQATTLLSEMPWTLFASCPPLRRLPPLKSPPPLFPTLGDAGRDAGIGPGNNLFDLVLFRQFHITERSKVQFRAESFNVFNHTNWGLPDPNPDSGPFFGRTVAVGDPRRVQFALRYDF
jgi:hypothetical protein